MILNRIKISHCSSLQIGRHFTDSRPQSYHSWLKSIQMTPLQDARAASNWKYCSDHLPVSGNILGMVRVGSWNILNGAYISHMTRPPWQSGYLVEQEKKRSDLYSNLSQREEECYHSIKVLLTGANSLDVLCVQECSTKMFQFLQKAFLSSKVQLFMTDGGMDNHAVTLVKTSNSLRVTSAFSKILWNRTYIPLETKTQENPEGIQQFAQDRWRPAPCVKLIKITPSGKEEEITVVNLHISSAGQKDCYKIARGNELFTGLQELLSEKSTLVAAGDYNMSNQLLDQTGLGLLKNLSDYHAHIDAKKPEIYAIDHLLVKTHKKAAQFCGPIPLKDSPDERAMDVYQNALHPIISFNS